MARPYDARITARIDQMQAQRAAALATAQRLQDRIAALQSLKGKLASGRLGEVELDILIDEGLEKDIL